MHALTRTLSPIRSHAHARGSADRLSRGRVSRWAKGLGLAILALTPVAAVAQGYTLADVQVSTPGGDPEAGGQGPLSPPASGFVAVTGTAPNGGIYSASGAVSAGVGAVVFDQDDSSGYGQIYDDDIAGVSGDVDWVDPVTVGSATLPAGTPVELQLSDTFAGFTASFNIQAGGFGGDGSLGETRGAMNFSVTPSLSLPTNTATIQTTITTPVAANDIVSLTTETTTVFTSLPVLQTTVGSTFNIGETFNGNEQVDTLGVAYMAQYMSPSASYLGRPYSFTVLSPGDHISSDITLFDETGYNWTTPVAGPPTSSPIDPFSYSLSPAPEPSQTASLAVGGFGIAALALMAYRRKSVD